MDNVIADILRHGVTDQEVKRAKSNLIADAVYARDNQQSLAQAYGSGLTTGESVEDVTAFPEKVAAVTVDQVNDAATLVLGQRGYVTGYLSPENGSQ